MDGSQVVQVHEGRFVRRIYYNVGVVNNFCINLGHHSQFVCWGRFPTVAIHDNRVVMTYDCAYVRHSTYSIALKLLNHKAEIRRMMLDWGEK